MSDPVTNNFSLIQPTVGSDLNTWGGVLNAGVIGALDTILGANFAVAITTNDVTITTSQFQNAIFIVSGALTGARNLIIPLSPNSGSVACGGRFVVVNNTTGAYNLTVLTAASASVGVVVPQGFTAFLYSDGTNVGYTDSGLPAYALASNGPPSGQLAGTAASVNTNASLAFDYTNRALYVCVTTGTSSTAGWSAVVPPTGSVTQSLLATGAAPGQYIAAQPNDNLVLAYNTTNSITLSPGRVRDDSEATNLQIAAIIYKRLDTTWVAGGASSPGNGGCDSGTKGNNQTWHAYLIGKLGLAVVSYARTSNVVTLTITGDGLGIGTTARIINTGNSSIDGLYAITAVTTNTISYANSGVNITTTTAPTNSTCDAFDVLASQSYNSPTLPSGWTVKQCVGSICTDGSANIRQFTQRGDEFWWNTTLLDFGTNSFTGPANETLNAAGPYSVPLGVSVKALMNVRSGSTGVFIYLYNPNDASTAPSSSAAPLASIGPGPNIGEVEAWTNTSAQIGINASAAPVGVQVVVLGWRDPRRRMF